MNPKSCRLVLAGSVLASCALVQAQYYKVVALHTPDGSIADYNAHISKGASGNTEKVVVVYTDKVMLWEVDPTAPHYLSKPLIIPNLGGIEPAMASNCHPVNADGYVVGRIPVSPMPAGLFSPPGPTVGLLNTPCSDYGHSLAYAINDFDDANPTGWCIVGKGPPVDCNGEGSAVMWQWTGTEWTDPFRLGWLPDAPSDSSYVCTAVNNVGVVVGSGCARIGGDTDECRIAAWYWDGAMHELSSGQELSMYNYALDVSGEASQGGLTAVGSFQPSLSNPERACLWRINEADPFRALAAPPGASPEYYRSTASSVNDGDKIVGWVEGAWNGHPSAASVSAVLWQGTQFSADLSDPNHLVDPDCLDFVIMKAYDISDSDMIAADAGFQRRVTEPPNGASSRGGVLLVPTTDPTDHSPQLVQVVSRMAHGEGDNAVDFDLPIPLDGSTIVSEPRRDPYRSFTFVLTFSEAVTALDSSQNRIPIIPENFSVNSPANTHIDNVTVECNTIILGVTVSDMTCLEIKPLGLFDSTENPVPETGFQVRILRSDVCGTDCDAFGDGVVDSTDVGGVLAHEGEPLDISNFRYDINCDGIIDYVGDGSSGDRDLVLADSTDACPHRADCPNKPVLESALSRKSQGGVIYDIPFINPATSSPYTASNPGGTTNTSVECRANGVTKAVIKFDRPVVRVDGSIDPGDEVDVVTGGTIDSLDFVSGGPCSIIVNMTTLNPNGSCVTIRLRNIRAASGGLPMEDTTVSIVALVGDVTGNGAVDIGDINAVKAASGSALDSSAVMFRRDVTANGAIDIGDINNVKSLSGNNAPACP